MRFEPASFIKLLESCHVQLWRNGAKIRCRAPRGFITDALRDTAKRHKPALLPLLPLWEGNQDVRQ